MGGCTGCVCLCVWGVEWGVKSTLPYGGEEEGVVPVKYDYSWGWSLRK